ncbi:relaxin-3 receptor 1-like [Chiloscyllium plagiosum]|uniref:relaxin-3 receptor 1-like n=1 Tax=Chiloscyllium plagiosum TaxID=36176 RepID=UPI001CB8031C|nr:relaxin-3 receptor 1-like [Chiloscyllium plagiosum]
MIGMLLWLGATMIGTDLDNATDNDYLEINSTSIFEPGNFGVLGAFYTILRITIALIYSVTCAMGILGNLLVLYLIQGFNRQSPSTINRFVFNLALTDFHFVLVLPFWAAEIVLDHIWPFGLAMCKLVLFVTVLNMYASVFFLTAMSVSRYCSMVQTLRPGRTPFRPCMVKCVILAIWLTAIAVTLPLTIYSQTVNIYGDELCIQKFPAGQYFLAFQHIQRILLTFIIPLTVITVCYLLLIRFLHHHKLSGNNAKRQSKVTKSVILLIMSFLLCWLPNHVITCWGVLVKLELVHWSRAYYITHTYIHPFTICLAYTNSCLNPIIYCLMRREFREAMKNVFQRISSVSSLWTCQGTTLYPSQHEANQVGIPLNQMNSQLESNAPGQRCNTLPSTTSSLVQQN